MVVLIFFFYFFFLYPVLLSFSMPPDSFANMSETRQPVPTTGKARELLHREGRKRFIPLLSRKLWFEHHHLANIKQADQVAGATCRPSHMYCLSVSLHFSSSGKQGVLGGAGRCVTPRGEAWDAEMDIKG